MDLLGKAGYSQINVNERSDLQIAPGRYKNNFEGAEAVAEP